MLLVKSLLYRDLTKNVIILLIWFVFHRVSNELIVYLIVGFEWILSWSILGYETRVQTE